MMKENNLGDANKFYVTLDEVDSLSSESNEAREKMSSFCRGGKRNKEEKKIKKCIGNKEISIESRVGLAFGNWLNEYTAFLAKQSIYRNTKVI